MANWEETLQEVNNRENQNREEHSSDQVILNYIGEWDITGYYTNKNNIIDHGELWEFLTQYKYMCKLSNVYDKNGRCILDRNAEKFENVLEYGCDWGHAFKPLEYISNNVYGIEATEWAVKLGKEKGRNIIQGLMEHTPYEDNFFDLIVSNHVLEHGITPEITLTEMYRILKVGGWAIHTLPCRLDRWIEPESLIHKSNMNYSQWIMAFINQGFSIKNNFFMWNHNQEDFTIIARK